MRQKTIAGFQLSLPLGGHLQMKTQLSHRVKYSSQVLLSLCWVSRIYSLMKFIRFHKAWSGNMCKVKRGFHLVVNISK